MRCSAHLQGFPVPRGARSMKKTARKRTSASNISSSVFYALEREEDHAAVCIRAAADL
ncbi:hypothetical protein L484_012773 [Morus notabilis]|uniref:Uncharacterized protein n=1 Tax=Morus notabilis TaxID=981085 RepID=W9S3S9_9ROSA|nr:hypothetical protein L484_012773 [Morus notabilis]